MPDKPEDLYPDNLKKQVAAAEKTFQTLKANELKPPMVMAVEEGKVENCRVHVRGDTQNLGDAVPRHFLSVLDGDKIVANAGAERPPGTGAVARHPEQSADRRASK